MWKTPVDAKPDFIPNLKIEFDAGLTLCHATQTR